MRSKLKILITVMILICMVAALTPVNTSIAPINTDNTILFQGYLTSDDGKPFFGTVTMGFKFYKDQSPVTDNVVIPTVDNVNPVLIRAVQIYNGQYATKLALPTAYLDILRKQQNIWIEIWVAEGRPSDISESDLKPMIPLVQLTAVAKALSVRGIYYDNDASVIKIGQGYRYKSYGSTQSNIDLVVSGNVGIGTNDTSAARLVVNGDMKVSGGEVRVSGSITPDTINDKTVIREGESVTEYYGGVFGAVWN